ncbi:YgfZ/GcvT domain-containing protein [Aestuariivirga sp.]|uniref:CAF17-like 4Fe-4S cluster assembly/insertion protein YgfZ n=1 Tax=Aestuariivirga sp. TaxID=2650926 RepID=UPI003BA951CD
MRDIHFEAGLLPGRAVLAVTGPEAGHFLHNLLTADIERLSEGEAAYSALLSPQGKILFDMLVRRQGDGYLIDCAAAQSLELLKRLGFYKLRAKVEIAARDDLAVAVSPVEIPSGYQDPRTAAIGWRSMGDGAQSEAKGYDSARLALGLAEGEELASGGFFPHEANLDQLGGVSFAKGCYVGQEVVSRMEHRGLARSRILPVHTSRPDLPKGTEIRAGEKLIGTIVSSAGETALALIRLDRLAEADAPLAADGVAVTVLKPDWARYDVPGAA